MKTREFFSVLILLSSIFLLCCKNTRIDSEPMEQSKIERMRKIKKGTTYTEVVSLFGEPDEDLGSGLVIVGYDFPESQIVLHFFTGESLQGLWEIKKNGEKIIYIPLQLDE